MLFFFFSVFLMYFINVFQIFKNITKLVFSFWGVGNHVIWITCLSGFFIIKLKWVYFLLYTVYTHCKGDRTQNSPRVSAPLSKPQADCFHVCIKQRDVQNDRLYNCKKRPQLSRFISNWMVSKLKCRVTFSAIMK